MKLETYFPRNGLPLGGRLVEPRSRNLNFGDCQLESRGFALLPDPLDTNARRGREVFSLHFSSALLARRNICEPGPHILG
jgi:hypothetical protein